MPPAPAPSLPAGVAVRVRVLGKMYRIYAHPQDRLKQMLLARLGARYGHDFWALRDVSFDVARGEAVGIIGRNGSGKSTLLQIIAGILLPTEGEVLVGGRVAALLELGSGFNPEFTGRENAAMNAAILGVPARETEARIEEIAAFADIGEFFEQPVKMYSSGMFVRLAFAVAASVDADLLLIDEALAVGDVFFQQKCYRRLRELRDRGASILLVSHSMADVEQFCERALLLERGEVSFAGGAREAVRRYLLLEQSLRAAGAAAIPPAETAFRAPEREGQAWPWPAPGAFVDISAVPQVSNGAARCLAVAICDSEGRPRLSFPTGEVASFLYEFEILRDIEVPIGGLQIFNAQAMLIHGRNTLHYGPDQVASPPSVARGSRVRLRQDVRLDLGAGEYTFEVGLATISPYHYERRGGYSDAALHANVLRLCHLATAGRFAVTLPPQASRARHDGVTALAGECRIAVVATVRG